MSQGKQKKIDQIVTRIQEGDEDAFDTLFLEYYKRLCRFAWRYVKSEAIAEEIVQDFFMYLWENRASWEPMGTVRGYLYKSIKHRALDHVKHQNVVNKYKEELVEKKSYSKIKFEDKKHRELIKKKIKKAIENLPNRGKMVFKLHRHDGLTYKEIAQVMDISVKTVENHMGRVLKILREDLSHLFPMLIFLLSKMFVH